MPSVCAMKDARKAHISTATAREERSSSSIYSCSMHSGPGILIFEVRGRDSGRSKETCPEIFAAVDVGVRSLVIRNMEISHPGRLPPQLIADHRQTGAIKRGPYFLNFFRSSSGTGCGLPM